MAELALCRTCARPAARLQPLFTHPERYKRYALALKLATGLQIEMNDGLPQHICTECSQEVSRVLKFRTNSQKAQARLLELGYRKNKIRNRVSKPAPTTKKKELVVQENFFHSDESLDKRGNNEDHFNSYAKVGNLGPIAENNIHDCVSEPPSITMEKELVQGKNFDSDDSLGTRDHDDDDFDSFGKPGKLGSIEKNNMTDREIMKPDECQTYKKLRLDEYLDTSAPLYTCKECKKCYTSKGSLVAHTAIHTGLRYMCDRCGKVFWNSIMLLRHQRAIHGAARDISLRCPHCEYHAIDNRHLTVHMRTHTGERPYICDACGVGFTVRALLVQHLSVHMTERNVQCKECPAKFKSRHDLNAHRYYSHKPRRWSYQCTYCPKTYVNSNSCRTHMRKSHGIPNDQQEKHIRVPNTLKQGIEV